MRFWIGWAFSGLAILFLVLDAAMKLLALPVVVKASEGLGFPGNAPMARTLGAILAICTALYAFPRTSVLGAILLTGYLGGAVAAHVRIDSPLFTHILFGVYVGIFVWAGIYLRNTALAELLPIRKG
jgi:hypothetical protein